MVTKYQDTPDHPLSLFEGHTGLLALYTDLLVGDPSLARFPAFEMRPVTAGAAGEGVEQDAGVQ